LVGGQGKQSSQGGAMGQADPPRSRFPTQVMMNSRDKARRETSGVNEQWPR
jgi:hypothetical protein